MGSLSEHLRNLVVAKTGGLEPLLELPDSLKKKYAEQGARCSLAFLYQALGVTTACESGYKAAVNPRLHIEFTLMRLCFLQNKPSAGAEAPSSASLRDPIRANAPDGASAPAVKPAAAEHQPVQAEQPVAAAQPRRRAPKTGSALSISAIAEEKPEEAAAPGNEEAQDTRLPDNDTEKVPYMPEEKAKDLMEKNPAVRDFVAELGLDTK